VRESQGEEKRIRNKMKKLKLDKKYSYISRFCVCVNGFELLFNTRINRPTVKGVYEYECVLISDF
jgi:hypothetical protein